MQAYCRPNHNPSLSTKPSKDLLYNTSESLKCRKAFQWYLTISNGWIDPIATSKPIKIIKISFSEQSVGINTDSISLTLNFSIWIYNRIKRDMWTVKIRAVDCESSMQETTTQGIPIHVVTLSPLADWQCFESANAIVCLVAVSTCIFDDITKKTPTTHYDCQQKIQQKFTFSGFSHIPGLLAIQIPSKNQTKTFAGKENACFGNVSFCWIVVYFYQCRSFKTNSIEFWVDNVVTKLSLQKGTNSILNLNSIFES
mmetsp:Transcript_30659/g.46977  ORF Transcript_30659/g.46977 Transcript_30659/m.46977 type:complete len:255 (+) Transcript_30659:120-884(+)